jgi:predicted O-methyltransferase YrrM
MLTGGVETMRFHLGSVLLVSFFVSSGLPARADSPGPDAARRVIDGFEFKAQRWNVPPYDGKLLHDLIVRHRAKRVLELGTSNGYSTLWMGLAARQLGGRVTTIEIDKGRHEEAKSNIRQAGLEGVVDLRLGDAFEVLRELPGPFDFVFIDIWKNDYLRAFRALRDRIAPGGVFTAHNVCQKMEGIDEFLRVIRADSQFKTRVDCHSGAGVSVSVRKGGD